MSTAMTQAQREAFLAEVRVGILSLADGERGPLASPVWYDYQAGGDLWLLTQSDSRKGRLLQTAGRASLCVQHTDPPYQYVSIEGPIVAIEAYDVERDLLPMAVRYLGAAGGRAYADGIATKAGTGNSIKVRIRPERWLTVDYGKRS